MKFRNAMKFDLNKRLSISEIWIFLRGQMSSKINKNKCVLVLLLSSYEILTTSFVP